MKHKQLLCILLIAMLAMALALSGCGATEEPAAAEESGEAQEASSLSANPEDEYYMVTFYSGLEFWKSCWAGFEAAGNVFGANVIYTGSSEYEVTSQVTVLEQIIAKHPAGIAVTCVNAEGLKPTIDDAIAQGIPVVCFDSDSAESARYSILGTGNYNAGVTAADAINEAVEGKDAVVGLMFVAGTPSLEERAAGFRDRVAEKYPNIKIVEATFSGEQTDAATASAALISANPDLSAIFSTNGPGATGAATSVKEAGKSSDIKVVGFDVDTNLLDMIKSDDIYATIAQGGFNMGYWAFNFVYQVSRGWLNPVENWQEHGINPLPPTVDTGVTVVTKDTVDLYYLD